VEAVQEQEASHHFIPRQLVDQLILAAFLQEPDHLGEAVTVQRKQRLDGVDRYLLGILVWQHLELLDERFGFCEPVLELLFQGEAASP
jgi:hypothetical protein